MESEKFIFFEITQKGPTYGRLVKIEKIFHLSFILSTFKIMAMYG